MSIQTDNPALHQVCIHCGEPVPQKLMDEYQGKFRFCCHGCETAYEILESMKKQDSKKEPEKLVTIELSEITDNSTQAKSTITFEEMDDPSFQNKYVHKLNEELSQVSLILEGMHCASCVNLIEKLPRLLTYVHSAKVNFSRGMGTFIYHHGKIDLSLIARTLKQLGYHPWPYQFSSDELGARIQTRKEMIQLAVAGVCASNTMLIAIALYAGVFTGMEAGHLALFRYASAILGIIAVLGPGRIFFKNAWNALVMKTPHMDLPVALGVGIGTLDGIYRTITNTGEIYFDSISSLVFLLLVGRFIQTQQKRQTLDRVSVLRALTPQTARKITGDQSKIVPADALVVNDVVEIQPGESIPADGVVLSGQTLIDQGLLTGEAMPVSVQLNDTVVSGTTNLSSVIRVKITATGYDTRLGKLMKMMDEAVVNKSPLVQFADRIGGKFIVTVLVLSAINMVLWWSRGIDKAIEQTVALLVVSCPCALGLATPLVIAVFQGRAAQRGILIKSSDAVERLAGRGEIWLDKTGTVTTGKMKLLKWIGDETVKPHVAAIESRILHPVAQALALGLEDIPKLPDSAIQKIETTQGKGVVAVLDNDLIHIGSRYWLDEQDIDLPQHIESYIDQFGAEGWTSIFVAKNKNFSALVVLGDVIRPGTKELVGELNHLGWNVGMMSGDHPAVVSHIAARIGIEEDRRLGGYSPEEKLNKVNTKIPGKSIVMAGDGVNDSAALMAADVGIAVHGGAEASLHAADIYLSKGDITQLQGLIYASRRAMKRIYTNFAFSLSYNVISVTLAMTGLIHPLIAALLMPVSSLTVLTIALKGGLFKDHEKSKGARP